MPVTLTGPDALNRLMSRHLDRFAKVANNNRIQAAQVARELHAELVKMDTGAPQGTGRPAALRAADYPFARRHGSALWPTPPIGVISGQLLASLQVDFQFANDSYTVVGKSVGTSYAQYVYSPTGTSKMVPRQFIVSLNIWAEGRMITLGQELQRFEMSLL